MEKELTCIVCPLGCSLKVSFENGKISGVSGNTCKRGEEYAINEFTNPLRTVTSTVMSKNGFPVSVKTDKPIPKDKIFECMEIINNAVVTPPLAVGDIIIKDLFGANIVVTKQAD